MIHSSTEFHRFLEQLLEQRVTTAKEIAVSTGVSLSTVYRWQRGETLPDISLFTKLMASLPTHVSEMFLQWIVKDLPVQLQWEHDLDVIRQSGMDPAKAKRLAETDLIDIMSHIVLILRTGRGSQETGQTLSEDELEAIDKALDQVSRSLVKIKLLESKRLVRRKSAKT